VPSSLPGGQSDEGTVNQNPSLEQLREAGFAREVGAGCQYHPTRWFGMEYLPKTEQLIPNEQIAAKVDNRTLDELLKEAESILDQIRFRAHLGDERAIHQFAVLVRHAANALETLGQAQPKKVRAAAEQERKWAVVLSLRPKDIELAKGRLRDLGLGQKATPPTGPGQRIDPNNYWTGYANRAIDWCVIAKTFVPILEVHAADAGAVAERRKDKRWRTPAAATVYRISGDCIVIADWQKQCVELSEPITESNIKQWWHVIQSSILEYWYRFPEAYNHALAQIGVGSVKRAGQKQDRRDKEDRRRNLAIGLIWQALKSLTQVR
jgi:hypothetical protein